MKKISDEQLTEIFGDVEEKINEQGAYAVLMAILSDIKRGEDYVKN